MNVIGFEKRSYYILASEAFDESFNKDIAYIKSVFDRTVPATSYSLEPSSNAQQLVYEAIIELQGITPHIEKVSKLDWLKIAGFVTAFGIAGLFFLFNDYTNGWVLIGSALLLLAFDLPSRFRARGE